MIRVERVAWAEKHAQLRDIRREVFIGEQKVPEHDEWDDQDAGATHFLAIEETTGEAVGTVRLLGSGKITRMAVRKNLRCRGIGSQLLNTALAYARDLGLTHMYLDAQIDACDFYQRFGFKKQGQPFWDAGILHIRMTQDDTGEPYGSS